MVPVPPLIALTFGVLGAAFVVRHFTKEWRRANADLDQATDVPLAESKSNTVPTLRRGTDGIYRP